MIELIKSTAFITKVVQLILSVICAILIEGLYPAAKIWQIEFTHATIYGFILINLIIVTTFIYDEPISARMRVIISGVATIFHLVTTVILLAHYTIEYHVSRRVLAAGLIVFINALIFSADCFFTSKYTTI